MGVGVTIVPVAEALVSVAEPVGFERLRLKASLAGVPAVAGSIGTLIVCVVAPFATKLRVPFVET